MNSQNFQKLATDFQDVLKHFAHIRDEISDVINNIGEMSEGEVKDRLAQILKDTSPSEFGGSIFDNVKSSLTEKELKKRADRRREIVKAAEEQGIYGPTQIQTRYCPDHPGVMVGRVAERTYQCPLDGKMYDYDKGFKAGDIQTSGGSVDQQTLDYTEVFNPDLLLRK